MPLSPIEVSILCYELILAKKPDTNMMKLLDLPNNILENYGKANGKRKVLNQTTGTNSM